MAELAYKSPAEYPDAVIVQDGHQIKINGGARWWIEMLLVIAARGALGSLECHRLQSNYYNMGRKLLFRAESAAGYHKAFLTYWGNRHMEIADGFADHLMAQHDIAKYLDDELVEA